MGKPAKSDLAIAGHIVRGFGLALAAFAVIAAAPAQADTVSAKAMRSAPEAASPSALGSADGEFASLFAAWQAIDRGNAKPASIASAISIPSRMPLDSAKMTSDYGMRIHPVLGGRRAHKGIDLASPTGTPIYATADGIVSMAQWFGGYGKYIQIEHGADLQTRYGHLSQYIVDAGQRVHKGDLIGYVGSTGRSTGPHLHYEVRVAGEAVNPIPYMEEATAAQAFALAGGKGAQGGPE